MNGPPAVTSWRGVAAGLAISASAAFQHFKLPPVLPDYLAHYPVAPAIAALHMSVYAAIGVFASGPLGAWLDRVEMGRALRASALLFALGCAIGLSAPGFWPLFLLSRALEGLGFAISAICGPIIAARSARPEDLPLVTGLIAGWVPLGQILSAALTALWPDWRFLWSVGLLMALCLAFIRAPAPSHGPSAAPSSAVRTKTGARADHNKGDPRHWVAAGIFLIWSVQFMAFATWLPSMAAQQFGLDLRQGTGAYVLPAVFILTFNILTGWALGRGLPILGVLAGALVLQALVWAIGPYVHGWGALLALLVYGIGAGIAPACLFHLPHFIAKGRSGAKGFGVLMIGRNLGSFAGPIALPMLVDLQAVPPIGLIWFAGLTLCGLILVVALWAARHQGTSR